MSLLSFKVVIIKNQINMKSHFLVAKAYQIFGQEILFLSNIILSKEIHHPGRYILLRFHPNIPIVRWTNAWHQNLQEDKLMQRFTKILKRKLNLKRFMLQDVAVKARSSDAWMRKEENMSGWRAVINIHSTVLTLACPYLYGLVVPNGGYCLAICRVNDGRGRIFNGETRWHEGREEARWSV